MEFEELKKNYEDLKTKFNLPNFDDLIEVFDIGKIERESGNLLRDIRGVLMEKIIHYVRLLELMVNSSQSTPVFLIFLREINSDDKIIMNRVFHKFVKLELDSFKLDIKSSEEIEAKNINNIFNVWEETQEDLLKLIEIMERNWNGEQKKDKRNYFN